MPVTVKDIAKKAGVSHSTVSRALRSNPLISDETTQRIQKIAVELGYLPSAAARTLKTNRSHVLGVVLTSIDDPFFSEILEGIEEVIQSSGYSLFIAAAHRDPGWDPSGRPTEHGTELGGQHRGRHLRRRAGKPAGSGREPRAQ